MLRTKGYLLTCSHSLLEQDELTPNKYRSIIMKKCIALLLCILLTTPVLAKNEDKKKKNKQLPPGLAKKYERTGELPPGWQKKIVQGEVLDAELYEDSIRIDDLPGEYEWEPEVGTEIIQIEDRIIRIKKDTLEILDILGVKFD